MRGTLNSAWTSTELQVSEFLNCNLLSVINGIPRPIQCLILGSMWSQVRCDALLGGILPFRYFRSHQTPDISVGGICTALSFSHIYALYSEPPTLILESEVLHLVWWEHFVLNNMLLLHVLVKPAVTKMLCLF